MFLDSIDALQEALATQAYIAPLTPQEFAAIQRMTPKMVWELGQR